MTSHCTCQDCGCKARIAELEAALKPFARESWGRLVPDSMLVTTSDGICDECGHAAEPDVAGVTVGDFRRAANLLPPSK